MFKTQVVTTVGYGSRELYSWECTCGERDGFWTSEDYAEIEAQGHRQLGHRPERDRSDADA